MKVIFMFRRAAERRLRFVVALGFAALLHAVLLRFAPSPADAFVPASRVTLTILTKKPEPVVQPPPPPPVAKRARALAPVAPSPVAKSEPAPAPVDPVQTSPSDAAPLGTPDAPVVASDAHGGVHVQQGGVAGGVADAKPAAVEAGPTEAEVGAALGAYSSGLRQRVDGLKHYPLQARRMHIQGVTTVTVRVRRDGQLACPPKVLASSHPLLDAEALRMVSQAAPFPPLPKGTRDESVEFTIPINFLLTS